MSCLLKEVHTNIEPYIGTRGHIIDHLWVFTDNLIVFHWSHVKTTKSWWNMVQYAYWVARSVQKSIKNIPKQAKWPYSNIKPQQMPLKYLKYIFYHHCYELYTISAWKLLVVIINHLLPRSLKAHHSQKQQQFTSSPVPLENLSAGWHSCC